MSENQQIADMAKAINGLKDVDSAAMHEAATALLALVSHVVGVQDEIMQILKAHEVAQPEPVNDDSLDYILTTMPKDKEFSLEKSFSRDGTPLGWLAWIEHPQTQNPEKLSAIAGTAKTALIAVRSKFYQVKT